LCLEFLENVYSVLGKQNNRSQLRRTGTGGFYVFYGNKFKYRIPGLAVLFEGPFVTLTG